MHSGVPAHGDAIEEKDAVFVSKTLWTLTGPIEVQVKLGFDTAEYGLLDYDKSVDAKMLIFSVFVCPSFVFPVLPVCSFFRC